MRIACTGTSTAALDRPVGDALLDRLGPADVERGRVPGRPRLARRLAGRRRAARARCLSCRISSSVGGSSRGSETRRSRAAIVGVLRLARRRVAPDRHRDRGGVRHLLGPGRLEGRGCPRLERDEREPLAEQPLGPRARCGTTRTGRCCRRSPAGTRTRRPSSGGRTRGAGRRSPTTPPARRARRRRDATRTRRRCRSQRRPRASTRSTATSRSHCSSGFQPRIVPPSTRWRRLTVSPSATARAEPTRAGRSAAGRLRGDRHEEVADARRRSGSPRRATPQSPPIFDQPVVGGAACVCCELSEDVVGRSSRPRRRSARAPPAPRARTRRRGRRRASTTRDPPPSRTRAVASIGSP